MEKSKIFFIASSQDTKELNSFLENLDCQEIEYGIEYDTDNQNGALIIITY